jgi:lysophospholipase L1-like esterase
MRTLQKILGPHFSHIFSVNGNLAIVGSSIVHWAERRARDVRARWSLLTATTTHWDGRRGMVWSQLNAACERMAKADKHPRWLIIHLGGNDLASTPLKNLIQMIQKDVMAFSKLFPETCIIWSDILPRATYRGAISNAKVEKSRKSLNNAMKLYMPRIQGEVIHHTNIQWDAHHLYRNDGVHLNDVGNDVMLGNITQAMMRIIASQ